MLSFSPVGRATEHDDNELTLEETGSLTLLEDAVLWVGDLTRVRMSRDNINNLYGFFGGRSLIKVVLNDGVVVFDLSAIVNRSSGQDDVHNLVLSAFKAAKDAAREKNVKVDGSNRGSGALRIKVNRIAFHRSLSASLRVDHNSALPCAEVSSAPTATRRSRTAPRACPLQTQACATSSDSERAMLFGCGCRADFARTASCDECRGAFHTACQKLTHCTGGRWLCNRCLDAAARSADETGRTRADGGASSRQRSIREARALAIARDSGSPSQ